jgi:hypothetical protein
MGHIQQMNVLSKSIITMMQSHNYVPSRRKLVKVTLAGAWAALLLTTTDTALSFLGVHDDLTIEEVRSSYLKVLHRLYISSVCFVAWRPS